LSFLVILKTDFPEAMQSLIKQSIQKDHPGWGGQIMAKLSELVTVRKAVTDAAVELIRSRGVKLPLGLELPAIPGVRTGTIEAATANEASGLGAATQFRGRGLNIIAQRLAEENYQQSTAEAMKRLLGNKKDLLRVSRQEFEVAKATLDRDFQRAEFFKLLLELKRDDLNLSESEYALLQKRAVVMAKIAEKARAISTAQRIREYIKTPRQKMEDQLRDIKEAESVGGLTPEEATLAVSKLKAEFYGLNEAVEEFGSAVRDAFRDLINNTASFSDILSTIEDKIIDIILNVALFGPIERSMQQVMGTSTVGGGLGGQVGAVDNFFTSILGSLVGMGAGGGPLSGGGPGVPTGAISMTSSPLIGLGGLYASGGIGHAGETAIVGEAGPELIRFGNIGRLFPNDEIQSGSKVTVVQNFTFPGGDAAGFKKSQKAIEREAAQLMLRATRRV